MSIGLEDMGLVRKWHALRERTIKSFCKKWGIEDRFSFLYCGSLALIESHDRNKVLAFLEGYNSAGERFGRHGGVEA